MDLNENNQKKINQKYTPAKIFLNRIRVYAEISFGRLSNEKYAKLIGITKGQLDRYLYRDSPLFCKGGQSLHLIAYTISEEKIKNSLWTKNLDLIRLLTEYSKNEIKFAQKSNLKKDLYGLEVLNWISRKTAGYIEGYETIYFIKDLAYETGLNFNELSLLFGKYPRYLDNLKFRITKNNPEFKFSIDDLENLKNNLFTKYKLYRLKRNRLFSIIDKYIKSNQDLPEYINQQYPRYHPNLNSHYFAVINDKTKAYWLGFLCADGYISTTRYGRLGLNLALKDRSHLEKFCRSLGIDTSYIKTRKLEKDYKNQIKVYYSANLDFYCKPIYKDLKSLNFKQFPKLSSKNLYLAWLLGLYDGDGFQGHTDVCSASKNLLIKIRNYFDIKNEIRTYKYDEEKGHHMRIAQSRKIFRSPGYIFIISLGALLLRKMLKNYDNSLRRKRNGFIKASKFSYM